MSPESDKLEELKQRLAALTQRVYRLEQQAGLELLKPAPAAPVISYGPSLVPEVGAIRAPL